MAIPPRTERFEVEATREPYFMLGEANDIKIGDEIHPVEESGTASQGGVGANLRTPNGYKLSLRWGHPFHYGDLDPHRPRTVEVGLLDDIDGFINPFEGQSFVHPTTGRKISLDNEGSGVYEYADPHVVNELIRRVKELK